MSQPLTFGIFYRQNKKKYWKMAQYKLCMSGQEPPLNEDKKRKIITHQAMQIAREDYEIIHKIV